MKASCKRIVPRSIRILFALSLGATPLAHAASGSGQAYGLDATINVNNASPAVIVTGTLPNPQADTTVQNPDTRTSVSASFNASPLTGPVLTTGVLTGSASATLNGFATDQVLASGGTDGTQLNVGIAGLVNVLALDTGVLSATAAAVCTSGAPTFTGSANIANLQVSVLGASELLNLSSGPNNTVLNTNINVAGLVNGSLLIISNEQSSTANSLTVNGLHVHLNVTITTLALVNIPVDVDMIVGHAVATMQSECAQLPTLSLSASPSTFVRGSTATYTATITNNSTVNLTAPVTVTENLSSGLTLVSGSATAGWSCGQSGQTVTCTSLTAVLPPTASVSFDVNVDPSTANTVVDNAFFGAANDPAPVSCTPPVSGCASLTTSVISAAPNLSVALSANPDPFTQGGTGTYTAVVTNSGNATATGPLTVTDILPPGVSYVSDTGSDAGWSCSASGQTVTCTNPNALPSTSGSNTSMIKLNVAIAGNAGSPVVDVAGAGSANSPAPDCNQSPLPAGCASLSTAVNPVLGGAPNLSVSLTGDPSPLSRGGTGTLTASITNVGNAAATAPLTITFALPLGLTYMSGIGIGWSCSAVGQLVNCSNPSGLAVSAFSIVNIGVQVAVDAPDSLTVVAAAGSGNAPTPANCASIPNQSGCASLVLAVISAQANSTTAAPANNPLALLFLALCIVFLGHRVVRFRF